MIPIPGNPGWLEAIESVLEHEGVRAAFLLTRIAERASRFGTQLPYSTTTFS